jgi:hypothetical protein
LPADSPTELGGVSGSDRHAHDWHQHLRIPGTEALTLKQGSPEGTEQLGERLLHLIGRHRHPRLQ